MQIYHFHLSPEEEVDIILRETKVFFEEYASVSALKKNTLKQETHMQVVQNILRVHKNGKASRLSIFEWFYYGTNRKKLLYMIKRYVLISIYHFNITNIDLFS